VYFEKIGTAIYADEHFSIHKAKALQTADNQIVAGKIYLIKTFQVSGNEDLAAPYFENLDRVHIRLSANDNYFYSRLARPLAVVTGKNDESRGYVMRNFYPITNYKLTGVEGKRTRLQDFRIFLNSVDERKRLGTPMLSMANYFDLVSDLLRLVSLIHATGLVIGDISHTNVLVQLPKGGREKARAILLDVDSFTIDGSSHPLGLQTSPLYRSPEETLSDVDRVGLSSDIYKIALLVIRLMSQLTGGQKPSFDLCTMAQCEKVIEKFGGAELVNQINACLNHDDKERPTATVLERAWRQK
jgi:serine/threonine protein kinase